MSAPELIIYHNGECSKCRGALEILQEQGIPHTVRWYLAEPLTREELRNLLEKLRIHPLELIRQNESLFVNNYAGKTLSDEEWLSVLIRHPELMQRPILECGARAAIARPPEKLPGLLAELLQ